MKIAARVAGLWAGTPSRSIASEQIIRLGNLPNRIDLLTTVSGVEFAACYPARITVDIDGVAVNSIDLENLRKSQQAAGRREDLADLEALG